MPNGNYAQLLAKSVVPRIIYSTWSTLSLVPLPCYGGEEVRTNKTALLGKGAAVEA